MKKDEVVSKKILVQQQPMNQVMNLLVRGAGF